MTTRDEPKQIGVLHRAGEFLTRAGADGEESRTVEITFSSETRVERRFGGEILDHDPASVDMDFIGSGNAPVLTGHEDSDLVGVVERAWIGDDRRGHAIIRMANTVEGDRELALIRDKIRNNISVGYSIQRAVRDRSSGDDDKETWRAVRWKPLEISLVSVPADTAVGTNRTGIDAGPTIFETEQTEMSTKKTNNGGHQPETQTRANTVPAQPQIVDDVSPNDELTRIREIEALGRKHRCAEGEINKAVHEGWTYERFCAHVVKGIGGQQKEIAETPEIGLSNNEIRQFSFMKAVRAAANPNSKKHQEAAGFELEASAAVAKRTDAEPKGIFIPHDVLARGRFNYGMSGIGEELYGRAMQHRAPQAVGTPALGGDTVDEVLMVGSFIDLLRNREILSRLGATYLTGLSGDISIPKQTGGASCFWLENEDDEAGETGISFGQLSFKPKTAAAYTEITRQLMLQSSVDVENMVRSDLLTAMALEFSRAAIYGTGATGQPKGVTNQTGITTVDFAGTLPNWGEVVDMETALASANADIGNMGYVGDAAIRGHFKKTEKFPGSGREIWETGNSVNGYRTEISNQIEAGDFLFGHWADLVIAMWGGLDLIVDPFTHSPRGRVRIVVHQSVDVGVRRPESFVHGRKPGA